MKLLLHLPPILASVAEYRALCETVEAELTLLREQVEAVRRELVISTARDLGLVGWEEVLSLDGAGSISDRRAAILSRLTLMRPYTEAMLAQGLSALVGEHGYTLRVDGTRASVKLSLEAKGALSAVQEMMREMLPANVALSVEVKLACYEEVSDLTHERLSQYTHEMIRNEVATNGANNIL